MNVEEDQNIEDAEMPDEYDFRQGVRGKYAREYAEGANVVRLESDAGGTREEV